MDHIEHDGFTYGARKMGLQAALDVLETLQTGGFFEAGGEVEWLMGHREQTKVLQRKLFGECLSLLNEQGDYVPLASANTDHHFTGRPLAYFVVLLKAINYQLSDFLAAGQTTDPAKGEGAAA